MVRARRAVSVRISESSGRTSACLGDGVQPGKGRPQGVPGALDESAERQGRGLDKRGLRPRLSSRSLHLDPRRSRTACPGASAGGALRPSRERPWPLSWFWGTMSRRLFEKHSASRARGSGHAAPLHSCKYRWLHAPATTIADSRSADPIARGCRQHPTEIPDNLKKPVTGRNRSSRRRIQRRQ